MQIMVREHNMLHRQAIILKAATYPLNDKDRQRLKASLHASQYSTYMSCFLQSCLVPVWL
jgi:hypothetical protein